MKKQVKRYDERNSKGRFAKKVVTKATKTVAPTKVCNCPKCAPQVRPNPTAIRGMDAQAFADYVAQISKVIGQPTPRPVAPAPMRQPPPPPAKKPFDAQGRRAYLKANAMALAQSVRTLAQGNVEQVEEMEQKEIERLFANPEDNKQIADMLFATYTVMGYNLACEALAQIVLG